MKAAILKKARVFSLETLPDPSPGEDELLVRTAACGICTSELDIWEGKAVGLEFPRFIGHEPSGIVEAVGRNVTAFQVGDRVGVWSEGKGFAERILVKQDYAYKLAEDTELEHALGEPIACAVNGVRKADPQLNDTVCIVGCGFMGLIMLQVFKVRGVGRIIAVDTRESILECARVLGATHVLDPRSNDVKKELLELTEGRGVDIGVEAAGNQQTLDLVSELVRMEGKLEVFGFHQGEPRRVNWGYWNWMAFHIVNGHVRSARTYVEGMQTGLRLLESGKLNMELLVTHRFPLAQINEGFDLAAKKPDGYVKGIVTMEA